MRLTKEKYTKTERTIIVPEYIWRELDAFERANTGDHIDKQDVIILLKEIAKRR